MLPIEYVKWYDHYAVSDPGIHNVSLLSKRINDQEYDLIFSSVGFLCWENETKLCIAPHMRSHPNDPDPEISQWQVIYKALIIERHTLTAIEPSAKMRRNGKEEKQHASTHT